MRLAINVVLAVLGNAVGLLVASIVVGDFSVNLLGFMVSLLFFTIAQAILAPFVLKMAIRYAPLFRGGIALVTVFIVLILTVVFTHGITIRSLSAWVIAPLVIWLGTVIAGIILPMILFKKFLSRSKKDS